MAQQSDLKEMNQTNVHLEILRQMSNNASQASNEISNAFYVYLVAVSVAIPGIAGLATVYLQSRNDPRYIYTSVMLEALAASALFVVSFVSRLFLKRFGELSTKQNDAIDAMNAIKLALQATGVNPDLLKADVKQVGYQSIPAYIRHITILLGSACLAGTIFIFIGFFMYRVALQFGWVVNFFAYTFAVVLALSIWVAIFVRYERKYR